MRTWPSWRALVAPKRNLTKTELWVLGALAVVPLFTMVARIMALPGVLSPALHVDLLRRLGEALNQSVSLAAVPPDQREHILYLLFFPTCALLVAATRLTFGIRVLGFRSILIAVGFHQSGIVPSLLLILVAVATIVLVRPWLRRIRLPYYARVSVVLCIVATTMVGALLVAPWMHSNVLWGVAYFPVIVLGMLAEGIAHTLDRDNVVVASWRAITTIVLAFLIAVVCRIPALRSAALQFPELALTQIVAIVFLAEFLDLRLFQDWDNRVAGVALPRLLSNRGTYRVAVVRNRVDTGVIGRLGRPSSRRERRRSVQKIADALRAGGHTVKVVEGDPSLLKELRQFLPPNPRTGEPGGIAFNLGYGLQGQARAAHVPAMLEMAGVAYTGADPAGQALVLDRWALRSVLQQAGIPTPAFALVASPRERPERLQYPLRVTPRWEPNAGLRLAQDRPQLRDAVRAVRRRFGQPAFVEEWLAGRRFHVALLGNDPVECLPLVELDAAKRERTCPARVDAHLAERIRNRALAAFDACGCRDYARVEVRLGEPSDEPYVCEVGTLGILAARGSFASAAAQADLSFSQLVGRIVEIARGRYVLPEIGRLDAETPSAPEAEAIPPKVLPLY